MPLIVVGVKLTVLPDLVIAVSWVPPGPAVGSRPVRPFAPVPTLTVNASVLLLHGRFEYEEALRPSSQVNICRALTIGTLWFWADWSRASLCAVAGWSVCMLTTKAP